MFLFSVSAALLAVVYISLLPFTAMLSPRCASVRISSQSAMVNDVPPPPPDEVSRGSREVTAVRRDLLVLVFTK